MTSRDPRCAAPSPTSGALTARQALALAAERLAWSATPRLDVELLLAHAMGLDRAALLLDLSRPAPPAFWPLVERREAHEPVAYLTGTRGFWTLDLHVAPGVLVPRADTETLLDLAVAHYRGTPGPSRVLDLGTGSGALLLAALDQWPGATGVGLDTSPAALAVARANAERLGLADRALIAAGGWTGTGEAFDLVLSNPPYIAEDADLPREVSAYEPACALFAGPDGLDDHRRIAAALRVQIAAGGLGAVEIGHDQGDSAAALYAAHGFEVALHRDLAGRARALALT